MKLCKCLLIFKHSRFIQILPNINFTSSDIYHINIITSPIHKFICFIHNQTIHNRFTIQIQHSLIFVRYWILNLVCNTFYVVYRVKHRVRECAITGEQIMKMSLRYFEAMQLRLLLTNLRDVF